LSSIRVTYSGLIAFLVGLIGVFSGLIFVLMITRRLSPEEFGMWTLIGSILSYFLISEIVISFWATRQIARNINTGKTSLLSSGLFALILIPVYLIYVTGISENSNANFNTMIIGVILLPAYFLSQTLRGINLGHKPQATSYSLLTFEVIKIPIALALVVIFELGVQGAILAVFFAYLVKIGIQLYFAKTKLQNKFSFTTMKGWLRLFWSPLFLNTPQFIQSIDIVLYSVIIGSVVGIAFYHASFTIAAIVVHSALITQALYPKILAEKSIKHIKNNFTLLMYFSIPLLGIAILFSKPGLFALNPVYQSATMVAILLSLKTFVYVIREVPRSVLLGIEDVDLEQRPKFSVLLKSNLFLVPKIISIFNAIYIGSLLVLFFWSNTTTNTEIEIVTFWAFIGLILEIPTAIVLWIYMKKKVTFSFPFIPTIKYIGATILFSLVFIFTSDFIINYEISIYKFLPSLILQLTICVAIYFGITYIIDKKTRILFQTILNSLRNKI